MVVGCGFLGEAAADFFYRDGWEVTGVVATAESAVRLSSKPYPVEAIDLVSGGPVRVGVGGLDVMVYCVSSPRGAGVEGYRCVYRDGLERAMELWTPERVIYTGSTSVYGQRGGEWVDESAPAVPAAPTGDVLLEAEQLVLGQGGTVLRLAGLYGPGRSILLRRYLSGEARIGNGGVRWINQIHRDDAARAIVHSAANKLPGVFNVCDSHPATQRDIYGWIAEALGGPLPPEGEDLPRKRGNSDKRVSNRKILRTGWQPKYPSYRDALPDLLAATPQP